MYKESKVVAGQLRFTSAMGKRFGLIMASDANGMINIKKSLVGIKLDKIDVHGFRCMIKKLYRCELLTRTKNWNPLDCS